LISEIVLVVRPDAEAEIGALVDPLRQQGIIRLAHGGAQRQDSVQNGLALLGVDVEYALIQDAARPFVSAKMVENVFAAAESCGAAVCGAPSSDTLKEAEADGKVVRTLDRSKIWTVQTPQIFRRSILAEAYAHVARRGETVTDDTAAVEALGREVRVVLTHEVNLKVTTPADWKLAEAYLLLGEADTPLGKKVRDLLHDINNPLTSVQGYCTLLEMELEAGSRSMTYLTNLQTAAERCINLNAELQKLLRQIFVKARDKNPIPKPGLR
jgi:2-C-methyl-D-erythritol 4-phosphate cytidylyltransferase